MDSQDYLNQISQSARPVKPGNKNGLAKIISSKYFKWGAIAFCALIFIIILGSMLGHKGTTLEDTCTVMKYRLDETNKVITEYQKYVKSSSLRSLSASLKGVFANTSTELTNFMTKAWEFDENKVDDAVKEEAKLNAESLSNELFEAKINGLLDRTYAHKMALEIYSVMSDEMSIYNATDEAELKSLLTSSHDSLNNLYTQFNDFSETK